MSLAPLVAGGCVCSGGGNGQPAGERGYPAAIAVDIPDLVALAAQLTSPDDGTWVHLAQQRLELARRRNAARERRASGVGEAAVGQRIEDEYRFQ